MLIKAFDGQMYFCVEEKVYALDIIPEHARISKNFDISPVREPALPGGALFMPRKVFTENEPFKETLFLISFIKKHHKTGAYVLVLLGHFQKCLTYFFIRVIYKSDPLCERRQRKEAMETYPCQAFKSEKLLIRKASKS
jgi:hypothetical protein